MAGQLPVISGKEVRKAFEKGGWEYVRQRGSHMIMVKAGSIATLSVPNQKPLPEAPCEALSGHRA